MRESTIEGRCVQLAKGHGLEVYKLTGRGDPDRLFIMPGKEGLFFVEFKAPGEKPRAHQQREIDRLRARGFSVHVIDNLADFEHTLWKAIVLREYKREI